MALFLLAIIIFYYILAKFLFPLFLLGKNGSKKIVGYHRLQ